MYTVRSQPIIVLLCGQCHAHCYALVDVLDCRRMSASPSRQVTCTLNNATADITQTEIVSVVAKRRGKIVNDALGGDFRRLLIVRWTGVWSATTRYIAYSYYTHVQL